ncbi:MAG: hypothetical protein CMH52_09565 [Myxococcales bacterium]|nr:hypothetical protein [Myxococcales bacterium]
MGFAFEFFGADFDFVYVGSNGVISLSGPINARFTSILTDNAPGGLIAGFMDDLDPADGGTIRHESIGEAPNREFVVEFDQVPHYASLNTVSFQIVLKEAGGLEIICVQCETDDGDPAGQGIKAPDSTYNLAARDMQDQVNVATAYTSGIYSDGRGDACDSCPNVIDDGADTDSDGVGDACDVCPAVADADQLDTDSDGEGDACDNDDDNDGAADDIDNCPLVVNPNRDDVDNDGLGDACDDDIDGDGILNDADNCRFVDNADQADDDGNGIGDACQGQNCDLNYDFDIDVPAAMVSDGLYPFSQQPGTGRGGEGSALQSSNQGVDASSSIVSLSLDAVVGGQISFWVKVSSESGWDELYVYLNNRTTNIFTGEQDWVEVTLDLAEGANVIVWEYYKDGSAADGLDSAWIDDVSFTSACVAD